LEILNKIKNGMNLSFDEARDFLSVTFKGEYDTDFLKDILIGLNKKGISSDELAGFATSMREISKKVATNHEVVDNCGTGGDGIGTFNISTVSSFIAASCGVYVAKHGNKAITSNSGSADLLTEAGANINLLPTQVEECLSECNFGFMFAPLHHQSMKFVAEARKIIAPNKTIFNLLGPLTNPAEAKIQLIGVYSENKMNLIAETLIKLGTKRALIVHSNDGLDEISIFDSTKIIEIKNKQIKKYILKPEDYNLKLGTINDILVDSPGDSLDIMLNILNNNKSPMLNICLINAAALVYISGITENLHEAIKKCQSAIESKKSINIFNKYINKTNNF
tara:strand:+ start:4309 stop:5316 length:1008 start_codon:yes stop_codon:yes gene_type:complete